MLRNCEGLGNFCLQSKSCKILKCVGYNNKAQLLLSMFSVSGLCLRETNQNLLCKLRAIVSSLLVTKTIRQRFWFNAHFCNQFHLATANNVQQPLANLSGNAHFSLATGSCQHVANQCRNHYEATDSQRWWRWKSMPLLLWTQTLINISVVALRPRQLKEPGSVQMVWTLL